MNPKIEELWYLSRYPSDRGHDEEKFAQLIVRECISLINLRQRFAVEDELNAEHAFDILVYDIEQHFGITHEPKD